jgi:hypothetical protein
MTDPRVLDMVATPLEPDPALPLTDTEEELLRYLSVGAALLPEAAERYRALSRRFDADGSSPQLGEEALEAAGDLTAVLGRARRHHPLYVALDERTDFSPLIVFAALEQIFHSLVLLTEPEGDEFFLEPRMTEHELDELLAIDTLQDYLDPEGALARLRPGA